MRGISLVWNGPYAKTPFGTYHVTKYGRPWAVYFERDLVCEAADEAAAKIAAHEDFSARIGISVANADALNDPLGVEAAKGSVPHPVSGAPTWPEGGGKSLRSSMEMDHTDWMSDDPLWLAASRWREARRTVLAEPIADVRKSQSFENAFAELASAEAALVKAVDVILFNEGNS